MPIYSRNETLANVLIGLLLGNWTLGITTPALNSEARIEKENFVLKKKGIAHYDYNIYLKIQLVCLLTDSNFVPIFILHVVYF